MGKRKSIAEENKKEATSKKGKIFGDPGIFDLEFGD